MEMPRGRGSAVSRLHCVSTESGHSRTEREIFLTDKKRKMAGVSILHWLLQNEAFIPTESSGAQSRPHMAGVLGLCFCFEVQIRERLSYQSSDTDCTRLCRPAMRYDRCFLDKRALAEKALRRSEQEGVEIETNVYKWKNQTTCFFEMVLCLSCMNACVGFDSHLQHGQSEETLVQFC